MNTKKKVNRMLAINIIISSIVWASVILACALNPEGSSKKITLILISGFFVEFLRMTSSNKLVKKEINEEEK